MRRRCASSMLAAPFGVALWGMLAGCSAVEGGSDCGSPSPVVTAATAVVSADRTPKLAANHRAAAKAGPIGTVRPGETYVETQIFLKGFLSDQSLLISLSDRDNERSLRLFADGREEGLDYSTYASPDGTWFVTNEGAQSVLVKVATGQRKIVAAHRRSEWSADGSLIALVGAVDGEDYQLKGLYDVVSGTGCVPRPPSGEVRFIGNEPWLEHPEGTFRPLNTKDCTLGAVGTPDRPADSTDRPADSTKHPACGKEFQECVASAGGEWVARAREQDPVLEIWNQQTQRVQCSVRTAPRTAFRVSPDFSRFVLSDGRLLKVYDTKSCRMLDGYTIESRR